MNLYIALIIFICISMSGCVASSPTPVQRDTMYYDRAGTIESPIIKREVESCISLLRTTFLKNRKAFKQDLDDPGSGDFIILEKVNPYFIKYDYLYITDSKLETNLFDVRTKEFAYSTFQNLRKYFPITQTNKQRYYGEFTEDSSCKFLTVKVNAEIFQSIFIGRVNSSTPTSRFLLEVENVITAERKNARSRENPTKN